ncbi:MAG: isocitrate lyase/phosphoenolpyruvate mutase family protein [Nakamurella sp.]
MTDFAALVDKARTLTSLHVPGDPLVLPNAWDASSAWVIAEAGAKAIATSSAACAWSIGRADGNLMTRDEALGQIRRIASAVDVPVTADVETGYGDDADLARSIREVVEAGAVGVNLEDSGGDPLYPIDVAAHRIAIARQAADGVGVPVHINARVDVFFAPVGAPDDRLRLTLERAAAYIAAGASSIFVPGVRDLETIRALASGIDAPINILAGSSAPSVSELAAAGVGRISVGSSLNLAMLKTLAGTVEKLLNTGSFAALSGIPYPEINHYFVGR